MDAPVRAVPDESRTVPVTVVVKVVGLGVPPPPLGEGQAMSSSDAANTASSSPAGVNGRLNVP